MELNQQKSIVTAARQELYDRRDLMDVAFFNLQGRKSRKSMGPAGFACLNRLYTSIYLDWVWVIIFRTFSQDQSGCTLTVAISPCSCAREPISTCPGQDQTAVSVPHDGEGQTQTVLWCERMAQKTLTSEKLKAIQMMERMENLPATKKT